MVVWECEMKNSERLGGLTGSLNHESFHKVNAFVLTYRSQTIGGGRNFAKYGFIHADFAGC
jgi:hypothetical protein